MKETTDSVNRIRIIDAIRGFSLLGILICNILIFQYGLYGKEMLDLFHASPTDIAAHNILLVAAEGSFMPIFMFLFGYSLFKLRERLEQSGLKPWRALTRRFALLLGVGLLHATLLWDGDILLPYGITGFVLLLFVNRKPKTLLIWAITLGVLFAAASYGMNEPSAGADPKLTDYVQRSIPVFSEGSYADIIKFRGEDPLDIPKAGLVLVAFMVPFMLLPMFLLGIAAAKKGWFHNPRQERTAYQYGAAVFLPLGILLKSFGVGLSQTQIGPVLTQIGGPLLALGYISAFAFLLSHLSKASFLLKAFESVGRLSLTNYLMQSVICTTLFYGYGLGWFGKVGVMTGTLLAIVIYALQAYASTLLLKRVKHGPFEMLLRIGTYFSLNGKLKLRTVPKPTPDPPVSADL
ncbi:DUF418 domain-containing protein [Paenibacillus radicis (ex Gao et al. 2016)]|uniref:DUF418 domain-containing protein n=1 Tax=Paenibacillus radicis (ex Gao et al. 2016) TaxID=1737354 RepID=A0A917M2U6_9BACL|nr:DUF418 domain-containing protein [Paenibacillus radicis (ex Gao et al. 2016)]GGG71416.1 hypothetical protein GCM10010918_28680 [Paenibacillus radicis (ex Gao et al. 2016)]